MPPAKIRNSQPKRNFLASTAALVIIIAGMKVAAPIVVPFLLSIFIAIVCLSPYSWLQRKGLPSALSLIIVIVAALGFGFLVSMIVSSSISDFSESLPVYQEKLQQHAIGIITWLKGFGVIIPDEFVSDTLKPGEIMKFAGGILTGLGSVFSNFILIFFTVIFILLEASGIPAKIKMAAGNPEAAEEQLSKIINKINRYVAIKTLISLITGIVISIALAIIGVDYPLLWGLLAFMLNYIPNIGSFIAAVPPILLSYIQLGGVSAILTAVVFTIVNFMTGNIIEPKVMGRGLGLSTLVVFLSLVFWGWVLGPVGMLLSVPLTMAVKIALDNREDMTLIAAIMSSGKQ